MIAAFELEEASIHKSAKTHAGTVFTLHTPTNSLLSLGWRIGPIYRSQHWGPE